MKSRTELEHVPSSVTSRSDTQELLYSIPPDRNEVCNGLRLARSGPANDEAVFNLVLVIDSLPPAAKPLKWRIGCRNINKVRRSSGQWFEIRVSK